MLDLNLAPEARADFIEIYADLASTSLKLADRISGQILAECERVQGFPHLGHPRDDLGAHAGLRSISASGFLIFYIPTEKAIYVLRIVHGTRDIGALFND